MREMRRKRQQMPEAATWQALERGTHGILGVIGEDGYPYTVPVSYACLDGKLYFHCAKEGYKTDAIRDCGKVSFTVVDEDTIVGSEYTTYFRSAIVTGRAAVVEDEAERRAAFLALAHKYSSEETEEKHEAVIGRSGSRALVVRITPEQVSGKEAIEYANVREEAGS